MALFPYCQCEPVGFRDRLGRELKIEWRETGDELNVLLTRK
jgi:hypothetical protein